MFGRGDLKYALLELLQERPKHGYEMIKELESRAGGFYTPSAGAIYPTLQLLEDRDWVTSQTVEGKKVYTITDAGRQALAAHQAQRPERPERRGPWSWDERGHERGHEHGHRHGRGDPWGGVRPEMRALFHEGRAVARLMRAAVLASAGDPERLTQLRGIVERARNELQAFVDTAGSSAQQRGEGPAQQGSNTSGPVEQV